MRVFPAWAEFLGLGDVAIRGGDLKVHDTAENYREAVRFIKADPLSVGVGHHAQDRPAAYLP